MGKRGISILLVEQNTHLAFMMSHRSYVIETGVITTEGASKELMGDERVKRAYLTG
jgi:branched-chain amino acid transport system ATP-binding protein